MRLRIWRATSTRTCWAADIPTDARSRRVTAELTIGRNLRNWPSRVRRGIAYAIRSAASQFASESSKGDARHRNGVTCRTWGRLASWRAGENRHRVVNERVTQIRNSERSDPESCVRHREVRREALTGAHAGWVSSFENTVGQFLNGHPVHARLAFIGVRNRTRTRFLGSHTCSIKLTVKARCCSHAVNACRDPCAEVGVPPFPSSLWWLAPFCCSAFIE
jgi:hypothetical protein